MGRTVAGVPVSVPRGRVVVAEPVPSEILLLGAAAQLSATKLMTNMARTAVALDLTDR